MHRIFFSAQGLSFERGFFLFAFLLALWGLWGGIQHLRQGRPDAGAVRTVVSAAALLFTGYHLFTAWFSSSYALFFQQPVEVHTYALAIVTGFLLATWVAAREGRRVGIDPVQVLDMSFWALVFGMIGARVLFILVSWDSYYYACTDPAMLKEINGEFYQELGGKSDCLLVFKFWQGGLVFYGAFIGAALTVAFYAKRNAIRPLLLLDTTIPSLALGQAFGRLGCLGAGCCWGQRCTTEFGVRYEAGEMPYEDATVRIARGIEGADPEFIDGHTTTFVHPTQLYESFGELAIFAALLLWRPHKRRHGEMLAMWMMLYGFWRTLTEMTRGDRVRGYATEIAVPWLNELLALPPEHITFLTTSQIIGLCLGFSGTALFVWMRRNPGTPLLVDDEGRASATGAV